jgi:hypothetical protein
MYVQAYRAILSLAAIPVLLAFAAVGYASAGAAGSIVAVLLPGLVLVKTLYFPRLTDR